MYFAMHIVAINGMQKEIEKKMTSKNDITGDSIKTKISKDQDKYADSWERIWGKKKEHEGSNGTDRNPPSGTEDYEKQKS
tara:strand:+ start:138 stop:377 length:240 start_codon:yes stop_codon:yes gene_type:complete